MAIPLPGSVTSAVSGAKASLTGQLGSWLPHLPHLDWQSAFQQQQRLLRIDFPTPTDFIVDRFEGEESLTDGFIWTIDLLSPDTHRELKSLIGQPVTLWLKQSDGSERPFSGRVFTVSQLGSDGGLVQFRMTVEPTLHLLRFARTPRVYQQRTAQGMIDDLLRRHQQKLPDLQWQWQLSKPLPVREYRLQVEESDLDFVRRVLHESGLPFTGVVASTKTKKLQDGTDFHTINELGYVPVLELDNGERLREGPAIVQYLADQVPGKNLAPANGSMERYRLQEWLTFIGPELHKGHSPLFAPGTPEDYKPLVRERLQARFAWVDKQLAGKDYLLGQFSVADAYLYTVSRWGQYVGVDLSGFANIVAFQQRMEQRPAVQAALRAEGLLK